MRIQHNIMALSSSRRLGVNSSAVSESLEKLSSDYRINRVGGDAAGLVTSEKMRAQIKGLTTASDNSWNAISLVQAAEGRLQEVHSMLNRIQELATKSPNRTYMDDVDRKALQGKVDALRDEINRIAGSTSFNGIKLLDGSMGVETVGKVGNETVATTTGITTATSFTLKVPKGYSIRTGAGTGASFAKWDGKTLQIISQNTAGRIYTQSDLDTLIRNASGVPAEVAGRVSPTVDKSFTMGSAVVAGTDNILFNTIPEAATRATYTIATDGVVVTATKAGASYAQELTVGIATGDALGVAVSADGSAKLNLKATDPYSASQINQMLASAGVNMQVSFDGEEIGTQIKTNGAGTAGEYALIGGTGPTEGGGLKLQIDDTNDNWNQSDLSIGDMHVSSFGIDDTDTSNREEASAAISKITQTISQVPISRGKLGAIQNRLEYTINNLGVTTENITAVKPRTRDVDMAKEMIESIKDSILMQPAQTVLTQANQQPQSILQLSQ